MKRPAKRTKNLKDGLTAAGRAALGVSLKPGLKKRESGMSLSEMRLTMPIISGSSNGLRCSIEKSRLGQAGSRQGSAAANCSKRCTPQPWAVSGERRRARHG